MGRGRSLSPPPPLPSSPRTVAAFLCAEFNGPPARTTRQRCKLSAETLIENPACPLSALHSHQLPELECNHASSRNYFLKKFALPSPCIPSQAWPASQPPSQVYCLASRCWDKMAYSILLTCPPLFDRQGRPGWGSSVK